MKLVGISDAAENAEVTIAPENNTLGEMTAPMGMRSGQAYHELADQTVQDIDALTQLHNNIEMLSDLQSRLAFVMREVKYLSKI